jgi:branched-chain amino acid transport system permease protein
VLQGAILLIVLFILPGGLVSLPRLWRRRDRGGATGRAPGGTSGGAGTDAAAQASHDGSHPSTDPVTINTERQDQ